MISKCLTKGVLKFRLNCNLIMLFLYAQNAEKLMRLLTKQKCNLRWILFVQQVLHTVIHWIVTSHLVIHVCIDIMEISRWRCGQWFQSLCLPKQVTRTNQVRVFCSKCIPLKTNVCMTTLRTCVLNNMSHMFHCCYYNIFQTNLTQWLQRESMASNDPR